MTAEHIQQAIERATTLNSDISKDVLAIKGFSTPHIRTLVHEICKEADSYLEVGLFFGASFCASFNEGLTAIGVEDHSQDFSEGFEKVKQELKDNISKFSALAKDVVIHYEDCFKMSLDQLPDGIEVYNYDGWHSEDHQRKALPYFLDKMADRFVWLVDDINWDYVKSGTDLGLNDLKDKIEVEKCWILRGYHLQNDPVWHNGQAIYLINKK